MPGDMMVWIPLQPCISAPGCRWIDKVSLLQGQATKMSYIKKSYVLTLLDIPSSISRDLWVLSQQQLIKNKKLTKLTLALTNELVLIDLSGFRLLTFSLYIHTFILTPANLVILL